MSSSLVLHRPVVLAVHGDDLVQRRPVGDDRRLVGRAPGLVHRDEGRSDRDDRGRPVRDPPLADLEGPGHGPEARAELVAGEGAHRHGVDVLVPEHPRDPQHRHGEGEHDQRGDLGVGDQDHVGPAPADLAGEVETPPDLLQQAAREPALLRHGVGTDRVEVEVFVRPGDQVALPGHVRRAVGVSDGVAAAGELTAQLGLERVATVVVDEDSHRQRPSPLLSTTDPASATRTAPTTRFPFECPSQSERQTRQHGERHAV